MAKRAMIVVGGGSSTRFGGDKLMSDVAGRPLVAHTLAAVASTAEVIVLVCRPDQQALLEQLNLGVIIVPGGATRTASEMAGLAGLSGEVDLIAIHDAARPLVSQDLVEALYRKAAQVGGAVPVVKTEQILIDRHTLRPLHDTGRAQTPQVFRGPELLSAYVRAAQAGFEGLDTADVMLRFGEVPIAVVPLKAFRRGKERL
ncbi:MAG: 2-C-methyl-D-erythritol 4-phosphate cytidylyltransferase, partial [Acidimicrobiia bacterium]